MAFKQELGRFGENIAADYFLEKGFEIIAKNFRIKAGEIDLIARYENELVFVEVKTRTSHAAGYAEQAITEKKRQRMARVAEHYMIDQQLENMRPRLDLLVIEFIDDQEKILHYENI